MGKSYKKIPIHGIAGNSDKKDKRIANRKLRSKVKQNLLYYNENTKLPILREVSNVWYMDKDGKTYSNYKDILEIFGKYKADKIWREIINK